MQRNENQKSKNELTDEFTLKVAGASIFAALIPVVIGVVGYFLDDSPLFWWTSAMVAVLVIRKWVLGNDKESRELFAIFAMLSVLMMGLFVATFNLAERTNAAHVSPIEISYGK